MVRWTLPISIHALLAESDQPHHRHSRGLVDFYPRSPCGERPWTLAKADDQRLFLSTLSLRRATNDGTTEARDEYISIHALLAESDSL